MSVAWWSDFREMVTDLFPPTFRATLWHQAFRGSKGFHQTGLPFFRIPNIVLQSRHSNTWSSSSPRRCDITAST